MSAEQPRLTDAELEIMQVLWELDKATVREVHDRIRARREVAYTTIMTLMKILEEKGHLTRCKRGRAYRYEPVRSKSQVISGMVDEFLSRVFDGSVRPLLVSLARDRKLSEQDLEEIAHTIREAE